MQEQDRKVLRTLAFVFAILALEVAWFLFIGPASGYAGYTAYCERDCQIPWWMSSEAWTAIFTAFLTGSTFLLWWQTRAATQDAAANIKIVERAYLAADFREAFRTNDGTDLELIFFYHNAGKTPAFAYEVYGEIAPTLPDIARSYTKADRRMKVDISVQADAIGNLEKPRHPEGGRAVFGYAKYRDVFGDDRITGFAAVYNVDRQQWEGSGPGCDAWNYST